MKSNARLQPKGKQHTDADHDKKGSKTYWRSIPAALLGPGGSEMTQKKLKEIEEDVEAKNFSRLESMQSIIDNLRDSYIQYKESARSTRIKLTEGDPSKDNVNRFYYKPKVAFMKKPEAQANYRKEYIEDVGKLPEPEPLYLLADQLQLHALDTLADRKSPELTKETLTKFFDRRFTYLQHKKYKLLSRWAHTQIDSCDLDANAGVFQRCLGILHQESDSIVRRIERLSPDEQFTEAAAYERPTPTISEEQHRKAQLAHKDGIEKSLKLSERNEMDCVVQDAPGLADRTQLYARSNEQNTVNSAIRYQDIEVYLRLQTYNGKINRMSKKLIQQIKWLPYSQRFQIWTESRRLIAEYKEQHNEALQTLQNTIGEEIGNLLESQCNVQDEKGISYATERYTYHLKGKGFQKRVEAIQSAHIFDMENPHCVVASEVELQLHLVPLAKEYGLNMAKMKTDHGKQFYFQLSNSFPVWFCEQVAQMSFEWEDSGYDPSPQYVDRLSKDFSLDKYQIIDELKRYAELKRKTGILGCLKTERAEQHTNSKEERNATELLSEQQFSRQVLLSRLRNIEFFTLDEIHIKLRKADWLEHICFEPNISDAVIKQNQSFSSQENEIDLLLKNTLNFTDVQDSQTILSVIDSAVGDHIAKVKDIQKGINDGSYYKGKREDVEQQYHQQPEYKHLQREHRIVTLGEAQAAARQADATKTKMAEETIRRNINPREGSKETPYSDMKEEQQEKIKRLKGIPDVNPLNANTLRAFYQLRQLKTRDTKIKLTGVLNYFRAIQRILALDLKEFYTRERALGEMAETDQLKPYFGKDMKLKKKLAEGEVNKGVSFAKTANKPAAPGDLLYHAVNRKIDTQDHYDWDEAEEEKKREDKERGKYQDTKQEEEEAANQKPSNPITLKAYKYNDRWCPLTTSTCPMIPKYHRTFGKPNLYESVAEEIDRHRDETVGPKDEFKKQMSFMVEKKDRIVISEELNEIKIVNEFGIPIMYEEALQDMVQLEDEMLKIGSFYINQYEHRQVASGQFTLRSIFARPSYIVDRPQLVKDLMEKELAFQWAKVNFIEVIMEAYEHTCDPLETVRILQIIVDVMAMRPRFNTDASMYTESYEAETTLLATKTRFFSEFIAFQKQIEKDENKSVGQFQEMKVRTMQEFMDGKWEFTGGWQDKKKRQGSHEDSNSNVQLEVQLRKQQNEDFQKAQEQRKQALKDIQMRHSTEFANEQYMDFKDILGLPDITLEELNRKQPRRESNIIDSVREQAFFEKQREGYPWFFSKQKQPGKTVGLHAKEIGVEDFYDSLGCVSKVNAALQQGLVELCTALSPENGFAETCMEQKLLEAAQLKLKIIKSHHDEQTDIPDFLTPEDSNNQLRMKGARHIEQDFFLGNTDKLTFTMREFQAELHPDNLVTRANPLTVASLDIQSVQNFNFPRFKSSQVVASLENKDGGGGLPPGLPGDIFPWDTAEKYKGLSDSEKDNAIVHRMIDLAKNSVARHFFRVQDQTLTSDQQAQIDKDGSEKVKRPSMLVMACNIMEVQRLREELIYAIHETAILAKIYTQQADLCKKGSSLKMGEPMLEPVTISEMIENVNLIDNNDGMKVKYDLAFCEYDKTLGRNLDFGSESCIKSLMTNLGVDELRAVLHMQVMQQQLLTVAVMTNTLVLDGTQRGISELDLYGDHIVVPNTILKIEHLLYGQNESSIGQKARAVRDKLKLALVKSKLNESMFWIVPTKRRYAQKLARTLSTFAARLSGKTQLSPKAFLTKLHPETKVRILREMRINLLHDYCKNVLREAYTESLKIQTMQACNELRLRAQLFPTGTKLFNIGLAVKSENIEELGCGELMENLSFDAVYRTALQAFQRIERAGPDKLADIIHCQGGPKKKSGVMYIATSLEIMKVNADYFEKKVKDQERLDQVTDNANVPIWEINPRINKAYRLPSLTPFTYQAEGKQKYGIRKLNFKEAYPYNTDSFRVLQYYTMQLRIFNLEYLQCRNVIPAAQVMTMETKVLAGCPFWTDVQLAEKVLDIEYELPQPEEWQSDDEGQMEDGNNKHLKEMPINERVMRLVLKKKKGWANLSFDMTQVAERLSNIYKLLEFIPSDTLDFSYVLDVLTMQHHSSYFQLLNGLDIVTQHYLDRGDDDTFQKINQAIADVQKRQQGLCMLQSNAFYIQQAGVSPLHMSLDRMTLDYEHEQFKQASLPVIDESCLIPNQVTGVQRIYGEYSRLDTLNSHCYVGSGIRNYNNLSSMLLNLADDIRHYIGQNIRLVDTELEDYLLFKGLLEHKTPIIDDDLDADGAEVPKDYTSVNLGLKRCQLSRIGKFYEVDLLKAKTDFLSFKIERTHLKRIFMSWILDGRPLPQGCQEYNRLQKGLEGTIMYRVLVERDMLNDIYWTNHESEKRAKGKAPGQHDQEKKQGQIEGLSAIDKKLILEGVNQRSPQYQFFNKVNIVRAEANLLKHLLEVQLVKIGINMINNEHAAVSAAFDQVCSEQEIQAFVHPNQQFAATVFQDVDNLGHLNVVTKVGFAQAFLTRLRNRGTEVETLTSKAIVFTMKDFNECLQIFCKSLLKYGEAELRTRSETHAIRENQFRHLVYIKEMESIYYQRKCEEFLKNIDQIIHAKMAAKGTRMLYEHDHAQRELRFLKDNYYLMEETMRNQIHLEYQVRLDEFQAKAKRGTEKFAEYRKEINHELQERMAREILDVGDQFKEALSKTGRGPPHLVNVPPFRHKDPDGQSEIIGLLQHIRMYKTFHIMKSILTQEKHDKEMKHMQDKMTQNQTLWEQLAESEKRENITRQELEVCKHTLNQHEIMLEKAQGQLEHLNHQKARLLQYKTQKSKRIGELESKMAEVEILEALDINKLLDEMKLLQKKNTRMHAFQNDVDGKMEGLQMIHRQKMAELQRRYDAEHDAKMNAFEKLESVRIEIKSIEGRDMKTDLWKDKCRELFDISQELQKENESVKRQFYKTEQKLKALTLENGQLQCDLQNKHLQMHAAPKSPTDGLREQVILGRNKPMTAGQSSRNKSYGLATNRTTDRNPMDTLREGGLVQTDARHSQNFTSDWNSITSNLSLPALQQQDPSLIPGAFSSRQPALNAAGGFRNQPPPNTGQPGPRKQQFRQQQTEKNLTLSGNTIKPMSMRKRYAGSIEQGMADLVNVADPLSDTEAGLITSPQIAYPAFYQSSLKVKTQRIATSQGKRSRRITSINSSQNTNPDSGHNSTQKIKGLGLTGKNTSSLNITKGQQSQASSQGKHPVYKLDPTKFHSDQTL